MGRHVNGRPKRLAKLVQRAARLPFNRERHLLMRKMQLTLRATRYELMVRDLLNQLRIPYQFQKGFVAGGVMYVADFYLPAPYKLVVEIDGSHHRLDPVQALKDRERDEYFKWRGFRVLRIENRIIETMTTDNLRNYIHSA